MFFSKILDFFSILKLYFRFWIKPPKKLFPLFLSIILFKAFAMYFYSAKVTKVIFLFESALRSFELGLH